MPTLVASFERLFGPGAATLLRFAVVGVITTTLDLVLFAGLTAVAVAPPLANVSSYSCGILLSYILNRSWTFGADGSRMQALKFVVFTLAGLLLSTLLVMLLTTTIPAIYAKLISVPVVFAWNYLAARFWVFGAMDLAKDERG